MEVFLNGIFLFYIVMTYVFIVLVKSKLQKLQIVATYMQKVPFTFKCQTGRNTDLCFITN